MSAPPVWERDPADLTAGELALEIERCEQATDKWDNAYRLEVLRRERSCREFYEHRTP